MVREMMMQTKFIQTSTAGVNNFETPSFHAYFVE